METNGEALDAMREKCRQSMAAIRQHLERRMRDLEAYDRALLNAIVEEASERQS